MRTLDPIGTNRAGELLRCCPRTVAVMCDNCGLRHYRMPGRQGKGTMRRIFLADLLAFAQRNGQPTDLIEQAIAARDAAAGKAA